MDTNVSGIHCTVCFLTYPFIVSFGAGTHCVTMPALCGLEPNRESFMPAASCGLTMQSVPQSVSQVHLPSGLTVIVPSVAKETTSGKDRQTDSLLVVFVNLSVSILSQ